MKKYDMYRKPETVKAYKEHVASLPEDIGCEFCTFDQHYKYFVKDFGTFRVIKNRFPYAMWDNHLVDDHLMLIPNRHLYELKEFTDEERADFMKALVEFDDRSYCIWLRDVAAKGRSVPHQHTHFIKTSTTPVKGMVFHSDLGNKYFV